ncbi:hypothetical protein I546_0738 [Mycobacterium kansasii 732]|nr:hypothetical protein I546_0738 [Mycobacterium kansasii 732]
MADDRSNSIGSRLRHLARNDVLATRVKPIAAVKTRLAAVFCVLHR